MKRETLKNDSQRNHSVSSDDNSTIQVRRSHTSVVKENKLHPLPHGKTRGIGLAITVVVILITVALAMELAIPGAKGWSSWLLNPSSAKGALLTQVLAVLLSALLGFGTYHLSTIKGRRLKRAEHLLRGAKTDLDAATRLINLGNYERAKESFQLALTALSHIRGQYERKYKREVGDRAWSEIETAARLITEGYSVLNDGTQKEAVDSSLEEARAAISYAERLIALAYVEN
jgi:soluble cytochrome b562